MGCTSLFGSSLLGWPEEQEDKCHPHGDPWYPASPLPLLVALMAQVQLGAVAQVWVSLVSQFPLVSCGFWDSGQLQQSCFVSLHSGQALPACACPLQVPAPPQVWASRSLPAQPSPAATVCPGRCPPASRRVGDT